MLIDVASKPFSSGSWTAWAAPEPLIRLVSDFSALGIDLVSLRDPGLDTTAPMGADLPRDWSSGRIRARFDRREHGPVSKQLGGAGSGSVGLGLRIRYQGSAAASSRRLRRVYSSGARSLSKYAASARSKMV